MRYNIYKPDRDKIYRHYAQSGKGPYFEGRYAQKGYGIGNILGSLARSIIPFASKYILPAVKKVAPKLLRTGVDVFEDVVIKKRPIKRAIQTRAAQRVMQLERKLAEMTRTRRKRQKKQQPEAKKRKAHKRKGYNIPVKRKKRKQDIFD